MRAYVERTPSAGDPPGLRKALSDALAQISVAAAERSTTLMSSAPSDKTAASIQDSLADAKRAVDGSKTIDPETTHAVTEALDSATKYRDRLSTHKEVLLDQLASYRCFTQGPI